MKTAIQIILLVLVFYYTPKFCYDKTEGFTLLKIQSQVPYDSRWDVSPNDEIELAEIFSQPFTYLAAGGQCYAFVSEDQKYVVKFFKHHLRRLPFWLAHLPLPSSFAKKRENQKSKRMRKFLRDFRSYTLAYTNLAHETGLLYLHLNETTCLKINARIIDKLNIAHTVDLDTTDFVLQKKASLVYPHLLQLVQEEKIETAKQAITSICELVERQYKKGIYDEDAKIHRNFGFLENQAIVIDVGRLRPDPRCQDPTALYEDLWKCTRRLKQYLETISPPLADHLDSIVERYAHG